MTKFLILDFYYQNYLDSLKKEGSPKRIEKYDALLESNNFSAARFNARSLRKLGHTVETFPVNDDFYHQLWIKENSTNILDKIYLVVSKLPFFRYEFRKRWNEYVIRRKIQSTKPDVLFIQTISFFNGDFFDDLKDYYGKIIAHISSPMPPVSKFKPYDLIITSFPHYVEKFKKMGKNVLFLPLAFDQTILEKIGEKQRDIDVSFVGSFFKVHERENKMLEELSTQVKLDLWGHGITSFSSDSPILRNYHGEAWGSKMYEVLARSKISINRHSIEVAKNYANNMRLYEATGMGSMLITDDKENISDLFEVGKEIVVYKDLKDLVEKIKYYLNNEDERVKIAKKGQEKTLKDHTYDGRMSVLVKNLKEMGIINE
jgi:hypothetical protein